jgi:hypothetical protein
MTIEYAPPYDASGVSLSSRINVNADSEKLNCWKLNFSAKQRMSAFGGPGGRQINTKPTP